MKPFRPRLSPVPLLPALLVALAALPLALQAQTIKPGLWELKQQAQLDPQRQAQLEQAQKQLAGLPAEQRKMMEQMMASRGVSMDLGQGGAITLKSCVTREQVERNLVPGGDKDKGNCKHDIQRSGNQITSRFRCTDPASDGETTATLMGEDRYSTQTVVRTKANGKTETIRSSGEARWLGADCGSLAPRPAAK